MKNFSRIALALLTTTALTCIPAVAQTRYCIGGDLEHLSAQERASCVNAKEMVRSTAARLHAPEDWHFVIVCGEQGWKDYAAVAERGDVALVEASADTDLEQHVTYLRQDRLQPSNIPAFRRVVAHELAAIQLGTRDEHLIEAKMLAWHGLLNQMESETIVVARADMALEKDAAL